MHQDRPGSLEAPENKSELDGGVGLGPLVPASVRMGEALWWVVIALIAVGCFILGICDAVGAVLHHDSPVYLLAAGS